MFRNALTFAAATCTAALLGHSAVHAYGHDLEHRQSDVAGSGWQISSAYVSGELQNATVIFGTIDRHDRQAKMGIATQLLIASSANEIPTGPVAESFEEANDKVADASGNETSVSAHDDVTVAMASPTEDADERIGKTQKDRNRLWDPIEGVNRKVLGANDWLDRRVFSPIARAYGFITPDFLENGIRNIFRNLREPATVGNRVLQGEFKMAGKSTARFLLNSTVGVAGFVDFADQVGLEREIADFGQTLYTYGVSAGPYLVLPLMGPTTTRDGFGQLVDRAADPATWVSLGAGGSIAVNSLDGVSLREEVGDSVEQLRSTSIDWYSTLRSAYYQDRRAFLEGEEAVDNEAVEDLFDEFDAFEEETSQAVPN